MHHRGTAIRSVRFTNTVMKTTANFASAPLRLHAESTSSPVRVPAHPKPRRSSAFTLIEMLVVILIISILTAVTLGIYQQARNTAWKQKTRDSARQIATAWNVYLMDNHGFPSATNFTLYTGTPNVEITFPSSNVNMTVLNGPKIYLEQSADQRRNGMKDKWNNPFNIRLDMNYDGMVLNPIDGTTINANVIVWSTGPSPANPNTWVVVWQ